MMKKLTALILAVLMLCVQFTAALAWNDHADTSWYSESESTFVITTAAQLAGMSKLSYSGVDFAGKTVKLGANIDLYGYYFEPIDLFKGIFDGDGHTIFNMTIDALYVDSIAKRYLALFRAVENATIKNLTMDHCRIIPYWDNPSYYYSAEQAIVACKTQGDCLFENIKIQYCEAGTYNNTVAGVVGEAYGNITFKNVEVDASNYFYSYWQSYDSRVAGILGYTEGTLDVVFDNCVSAPVLDVYNDVCSNYQYWHYRRCGMLIGNHSNPSTVTVTARNTDVYFGDWNQYYYCEFKSLGQGSYNGPDEWKFCRADKNQEGLCAPGHTHQDFESHMELIAFTNVIGGERGDRGGQPTYTVPGVTVHNDTDYFFTAPAFDYENGDDYVLNETGDALQFESSAAFAKSVATASVYEYDNETQTKGALIETFEASSADPALVRFESGSIQVTLTPEYLNAFTPGFYLLEIDPNKYNDEPLEIARGVFEIAEPASEPVTPPQTGDNANHLLWTLLLITSAMGVFVILRRREAYRN